MNEKQFTAGDVVIASYKTGEYIAELIEYNPPRAVVKVLAVAKHPEQGDLHHPQAVEVPLFHQRRALAYQEKAVVLISTLTHFVHEIPDYNKSLQTAIETDLKNLQRLQQWAARSIDQLDQLKKDYFPRIGT
ncbi:MAG: kinase [Bacilli bacterium]|nr:kinase [Bacilli bacterium]